MIYFPNQVQTTSCLLFKYVGIVSDRHTFISNGLTCQFLKGLWSHQYELYVLCIVWKIVAWAHQHPIYIDTYSFKQIAYYTIFIE